MNAEDGGNEPVTHSFIVKIWLEQSSQPVPSSWRGHVTHVPSAERRHFLELGRMMDFIAGYLVRSGSLETADAFLQPGESQDG